MFIVKVFFKAIAVLSALNVPLKRLQYFFLPVLIYKTLHLGKKLSYCSCPCFSSQSLFYSYDTEALNKRCAEIVDPEMEFENVFQQSQHKKINIGVQQLYLIGIYPRNTDFYSLKTF